MHPEEIKAAIRMNGTTPAAIADEQGVSRSMVSHVINGNAKSAHIQKRIAQVIGKPIAVIWPPKAPLRRDKKTHAAAAAAA